MKPGTAPQIELDFEHHLPAGQEWFSVRFIARYLHCSPEHVINLVESGEVALAADLRGRAASKSCIRVPRASLVAFLNKRKVGAEFKTGDKR